MTCFQGFVIPVKTDSKQAFFAMAKKAAPIFAEYGALRTVECWGDDVMDGNTTDLRKAVQAKDDEAVVFGWNERPDKPTCDAGMGALMQDPRMRETPPARNGQLAIFDERRSSTPHMHREV